MSKRRAVRSARPGVERLEDRQVPSAMGPVALSHDDGVGPSPGAGPGVAAVPADVPLARTEPWAIQLAAQDAAYASQYRTNVVFLGDSITYNWGDASRAAVGSTVWNPTIASLGAQNFGIASNLTQNVLWQLQTGVVANQPGVVVLQIGTNNLGGIGQTPEQTASGIAAIVRQIRTTTPQTKVLLMGIFPRGQLPTDPLRAEVHQTNQIIANLADGQNVVYVDIGWQLVQFDGTILRSDLYDYLHLNTHGYQVWADAIDAPLRQMLGMPPASHNFSFSAARAAGFATATDPAAGLLVTIPPAPPVVGPLPMDSTTPRRSRSVTSE